MDGLATRLAELEPASERGTWQRHVANRYLASALRFLAMLQPRALVTCTVEVTNLLDLRSAGARARAGLSAQDLASLTYDHPAYARCQAVAQVAHQLRLHGLVAPAAAAMGDTLVLFTDQPTTAERAWLSDFMPTLPSRLQPMVDALTIGCAQDERVRAGWLGGSLARGNGDDWSDIDLHLAVADPADFDVPSWLGGLTPLVLADPIPGAPGGYLCLTPEWVHIDVIVHSANGFTQDEQFPCSVLLDRDGLLHAVAAQNQEVREPYYPAEQVRIFVYFMGNAVTVLHRGELIVLSQGCGVMRDSLIALMLAENGVTKSDGAKRLNRYLTAEQRAALGALTPIGVDESALRAGQAGIAGEFLTRARCLAQHCGAPWPEELVRAAISLWERELQLAPTGWPVS